MAVLNHERIATFSFDPLPQITIKTQISAVRQANDYCLVNIGVETIKGDNMPPVGSDSTTNRPTGHNITTSLEQEGYFSFGISPPIVR